MSEAVSALRGAGDAAGFVAVREVGLRGMISLRGDLAASRLADVAVQLGGVDFPQVGQAHVSGGRGLCWMSPDELLILTHYVDAGPGVAMIEAALAGSHYLTANVSDARAVFRLEGAGVREVLAKLTPADVSVSAFKTGQIRRSRLAQAAAAFWMLDEETVEVVCFRSVAGYVYGLLDSAARAGSQVGYF
ncbi:MAG: sarcosine oxidase subunit gamma [Marinosulfonomonas sp.]|nr:sarcosine oxidase subunit gamma [Marinosulfonomonas sp.]